MKIINISGNTNQEFFKKYFRRLIARENDVELTNYTKWTLIWYRRQFALITFDVHLYKRRTSNS